MSNSNVEREKNLLKRYSKNDLNKLKRIKKIEQVGYRVIFSFIVADAIAWLSALGFSLAGKSEAAHTAGGIAIVLPLIVGCSAVTIANLWVKETNQKFSGDIEAHAYAYSENIREKQEKQKIKKRNKK